MSERINLLHPITVNGRTIDSVTMRRPTVGDQEAADKPGRSDAQVEMALFGNLCGLAPEEVRAMDMADWKQLQKKYAGFLS